MVASHQPLDPPSYRVRMTPRNTDYTEAVPLDHEVLAVRQLMLVEALESPYCLEAQILADLTHGHIDPEALVEADFSLEMARESTVRTIHGVVLRVHYATRSDDELWLRLTVGPAMAILEHTRRSRIFQDQSVPDIVQTIVGEQLQKYGRSVEISRLSQEHQARDYCVQYRETDLQFIRRILAQEGIFAVYDHGGQTAETLVLIDDLRAFGPVGFEPLEHEGQSPPPEVPMINARPELAEVEGVIAFTAGRELTTAKVEVEAWAWKQAPVDLLSASAELDPGPPGQVGESYDYAYRRTVEEELGAGGHRDETLPWATRRLAGLSGRSKLAWGDALVTGFSPGRTFELLHPANAESEHKYLLTRVVHTADCPEVERTPGEHTETQAQYLNRFECVPLKGPYMPAELARPRVAGIQTALVVGPPGQEIHTDEWGRIQVRMGWDREQRSQESDTSCWLRVAQAWAGNGWGSLFLPRIGMEVLVSFVDGDPDRPLCTGVVYNGQNRPPYALPDHKTRSVIKTASSPDADGFNELSFEDAAGREEVFIHAQKNLREVVKAAHSTTVGADQTNTVHKDRRNTIKGSDFVTVETDRAEVVSGSHEVTISGSESRVVDCGPNLGEGMIGVTAGVSSLQVNGTRSVWAKDRIEFTVGSGGTVTTVVLTPTGVEILTPKQFVLKVGDKALLTMSPEDHHLSSNMITLAAEGAGLALDTAATLHGNDQVAIVQKDNTCFVKLDGDATVTAAGVTLTAQDGATVTGSDVSLAASAKKVAIDGAAGVTVDSKAGVTLTAGGELTLKGTIVRGN